jgi:short-subunit dehydrogenase
MTARRKTALITGASSGIGEAFAEVFAANGFDLVITARRAVRLQALAERLTRERGAEVHVIPSDLAMRGAAAALCTEIAHRGLTIDALVNSAGFGVPGKYAEARWSVYEEMLQVMVMALSELTHRLLPGMIERGYGRIVNVASTAGLAPSGAGALYGAAKTFVVNFSTSLAREVSRHGVLVTAICPGLTDTDFHRAPGLGDTVRGMPRWMWMDARTVASQGFAAVMAGEPVYVNGRVNKLLVTLFRYVPHPILAGVGRQVARVRRRA